MQLIFLGGLFFSELKVEEEWIEGREDVCGGELRAAEGEETAIEM